MNNAVELPHNLLQASFRRQAAVHSLLNNMLRLSGFFSVTPPLLPH
jgi:hypothetical protein